MPEQEPNDYVIPVVNEEVHANAVPVETGGVRVIKRVHTHEEIVEQAVRQGSVDVKRVPLNQPVAGPQEPRREGNTLIIPVVSEVLRIEKQWVLTEEIHVTQLEETRTVQETVALNREIAEVQRTDRDGKVVSEVVAPRPKVLPRQQDTPETGRKVLTRKSNSLVKKS